MVLVSSIGVARAAVESRPADKLFNAWVSDKSAMQQHIWKQVLLSRDEKAFVRKLNKAMRKDSERYALFAGLVKKKAARTKLASSQEEIAPKQVKALYGELNDDIGSFIKRMQGAGWQSEELNAFEEKLHFQKVIDKNAQFAELLCDEKQVVQFNHQLFSLAQRMFFHLFDDGWKQTFRFFSTRKDYPILRFFYSTIWQALSGQGWKEWSPECLKALKKEAAAGKIIRYIAGGCDIRALLDAGIFNIEIIDPMLPTQPRYYVRDWEWLVQGMLGDSVIFPSGLQLTRTDYVENGVSIMVPDGKKNNVKIPESTTTWEVRNKDGMLCGKVLFVRRFCRQEDFATSKKQALLISFNELSFITCADKDNWGIVPRLFNKKMVMHVKQLYKPVTARIMQNMNKADAQQFSFIRLGSCVK